MKVTVQNSEILKSIEPNQLAAHLKTQGWHEESRIYENQGAVWRRRNDSENDEFEILLPLTRELGDYATRIGDAIKTLEVVEKRSQLEILSDLLTSATNVDIQGIVIKLSDEDSTSRVTLLGVVVNQLRRIYVELREPEHALAMKAYQERLPVVCSGDLLRKDSSFVLQNVRHLVLDDTGTD